MARSTTTITINNHPVQISDEQIFLATRDETPETLQTYAVSVNNALWPPTQLIGLAAGVPGRPGETKNDNSHAALKALNELGLTTFERVEYDTLGTVVVPASRKRTWGFSRHREPRRLPFLAAPQPFLN